jgi:hypothetical protein
LTPDRKKQQPWQIAERVENIIKRIEVGSAWEPQPESAGHLRSWLLVSLRDIATELRRADKKEAHVSSHVPSNYLGPIDVGMYFVWEPTLPHAWCVVRVTRIDEPPDDERRIWSVIVRGGGVNHEGIKTWNDESRFREACTPSDEHGRMATASPRQ